MKDDLEQPPTSPREIKSRLSLLLLSMFVDTFKNLDIFIR